MSSAMSEAFAKIGITTPPVLASEETLPETDRIQKDHEIMISTEMNQYPAESDTPISAEMNQCPAESDTMILIETRKPTAVDELVPVADSDVVANDVEVTAQNTDTATDVSAKTGNPEHIDLARQYVSAVAFGQDELRIKTIRQLLCKRLGTYRQEFLIWVGTHCPDALTTPTRDELNNYLLAQREFEFYDKARSIIDSEPDQPIGLSEANEILGMLVLDVHSRLSMDYIRFMAQTQPDLLSQAHLEYVAHWEAVREKEREELLARQEAARTRQRNPDAAVGKKAEEKISGQKKKSAKSGGSESNQSDRKGITLEERIDRYLAIGDAQFRTPRAANTEDLERLVNHNQQQRMALLLGGNLRFARRSDVVEKSMIDNDGVDHINCMYSGRLILGRFLDMHSRGPFNHPDYGRFNSIRGFLHYLQMVTPDERLRDAVGPEADQIARDTAKKRVENLRQIVAEATILKIIQNEAAMEAFARTELPLRSYVEVWTQTEDGQRDKFVERKVFHADAWYILALEEIRRALKTALETGQPLTELYDFACLNEPERQPRREHFARRDDQYERRQGGQKRR